MLSAAYRHGMEFHAAVATVVQDSSRLQDRCIVAWSTQSGLLAQRTRDLLVQLRGDAIVDEMEF